MSNILVVVPAHNEEESIYEVVTRALKYADVSVTDDGSKDRTPEILESIRRECDAGEHSHHLNVITHAKATHIPRAEQDGFKLAVAENYQFVITMDAGLTHDPDALPDFINQDPDVDVVIGKRHKVENVPAYRRMISLMGAMVVNYSLASSYFLVRRPYIRDCTSGYRRYSRRAVEIIANARLESVAFDFHMEALALCLRRGMSVAEIPITYLFSNSSFNLKVLKLGVKFGLHLIATKKA
jgi:dolichol-phosphate mannosyltransferase